jgi:uncharacterized phage protein (TIGR02218 family)
VRTLPEALAERLAGGVTTLCRCWKITRRDGVVLAFTDHDETVSFGGDDFVPAGGFATSADAAASGLAAGGAEIEGALSADGVDAGDLASGRFDGATVEVWLIDWSEPDLRERLRTGTVGEVTRAGAAFRAELRGLAQALDEPRGRRFACACDADLGDGRCGVDLDDGDYRAVATVDQADGAVLVVAGLGGFDDGWFAGGRARVTSGAADGFVSEVKRHSVDGPGVSVELWRSPPAPLSPGDTLVVTAGCDKRFATCRAKFDNAANFRGFPHMPGDDFALSTMPDGSGAHDGGTIV